MKKNKGLPALVQLAILTVLTTITWVGFEVYRTFAKTPEVSVDPLVIQALDPTLDQITLDRLVNRIHISDEEVGDTLILDPRSGLLAVPEVEEPVPETEEVVEEEEASPSAETI